MGAVPVIPADAPVVAPAVATATASAGFVVLGIPQAVLVAALFGTLLSFYFTSADPPRRIPRMIFGVIALSFAAAWTAQALPHFGPTAWTAQMAPQAVAGLLGLCMQFAVRVGSVAVAKFANRKAEGR